MHKSFQAETEVVIHKTEASQLILGDTETRHFRHCLKFAVCTIPWLEQIKAYVAVKTYQLQKKVSKVIVQVTKNDSCILYANFSYTVCHKMFINKIISHGLSSQCLSQLSRCGRWQPLANQGICTMRWSPKLRRDRGIVNFGPGDTEAKHWVTSRWPWHWGQGTSLYLQIREAYTRISVCICKHCRAFKKDITFDFW